MQVRRDCHSALCTGCANARQLHSPRDCREVLLHVRSLDRGRVLIHAPGIGDRECIEQSRLRGRAHRRGRHGRSANAHRASNRRGRRA